MARMAGDDKSVYFVTFRRQSVKHWGLVFSLVLCFNLFAGWPDEARADPVPKQNGKHLENNHRSSAQLKKVLGGRDDELLMNACPLIVNNEYRKFFKLVEEGKVKIPNAYVYDRTRCSGGQHILVEGVEPGSIDFMKKFLKAVRDKYGMAEVVKIINLQDNVGYTLLDRVYLYNDCDQSSRGVLKRMSRFLRRIGGKTNNIQCPNIR